MRQRASLKGRLTRTKAGRLVWQQERSILEVTESVCTIMERDGVTRAELARRLGKTKGYVSQLLDGEANMTIRTMSDIFAVLGYEFVVIGQRLDGADHTIEAEAPTWVCPPDSEQLQPALQQPIIVA